MIKKTENCLYCKTKMDSKTAKKKFCSTLCRVYFNREKKAAKALTGIDSGDEKLVPASHELKSAINESVLFKPKINPDNMPSYKNIQVEEIGRPIRNEGEKALDYKLRVAHWEEKLSKLK